MKKASKKSIKAIELAYEKGGQATAKNVADKLKVPFEYCKACETDTPSTEHTCILCGQTTAIKYARTCDKTGEGMNEGYCFGDGEKYFKYKKHATEYAKELGYKSLNAAYKDEAYYWTEWEEGDTHEEETPKTGKVEGWLTSLNTLTGETEIQKDDDSKKFKNDADALVFVKQKADKGSVFHQNTLKEIEFANRNLKPHTVAGKISTKIRVLTAEKDKAVEERDFTSTSHMNAKIDGLKTALKIVEDSREVTYFLFGEDACRKLDEVTERSFVNWCKNNTDYATFEFIAGETSPADLLYAMDGYYNYSVISEKLYGKI